MKANVLFFDRKPAKEKSWTQKLWIYDLRTNMHFTLKQNTLKRSDLDDFVACYNRKNRGNRKESERFKSFTYDELTKRDKLNLDIFWLKDDPWRNQRICRHPRSSLQTSSPIWKRRSSSSLRFQMIFAVERSVTSGVTERNLYGVRPLGLGLSIACIARRGPRQRHRYLLDRVYISWIFRNVSVSPATSPGLGG